MVPLIATVLAVALSGVPATGGRASAVGVNPNIELTPQNAQFGKVLLGVTSPAIQLTITSVGDAPAELGARSTFGDNAAEFETTADTCPVGALPVGDSCTIDVRFTPTAEGSRQAGITFAGNWSWSPAVFTMSGWGIRPESGITWGSTYKPGSSYTWTYGNALARTVQDGTQRLHQGYATNRVSGAWARDTGGPYAGIYYTRGSSGSTWSTPRRVTPTSKHAIRFGIAAAGSRVYVAYATQTRIYNYSPTAPRVLYVRRNTKHGGGSSWQTSVRLTGTTGRIDYPTIAASGYDVHVAWTNSNSGDVIVATSKDRGVSFAKRIVGKTTVSSTSGYAGLPSVAVSGSTVAVTWVSDASGTVRTRVSKDRGTTWGTAETVGTQSLGFVSTAVRGSRVAVAWTTDDDVVVRQRAGGTWADPMTVAQLEDGADPVPYAPVVMLQESTRIAVSWAEEEDNGNPGAARLRWAESPDGGAMWHVTQTVASSTSTASRWTNDWPSVLWPSATKRYVSWNGWTSGSTSYRQYLRIGTGAPVATVAATAWEPSPTSGERHSTVRSRDAGPTQPAAR